MNRILLSSICFVSVLLICIFGTKHVETSTLPLIDQAKTSLFYAQNDDMQSAILSMEALILDWEETSNILGVLLRHNEIDDLDQIFILCLEYAKNGNQESFQVETSSLIHRLEHLIEKEKFSIKNIF